MKPKKTLIAIAIVILMVAGTSVVCAQSGLASGARSPHSLVGSWVVNVIPDPATGISPFVVYNAYTQDGVDIGTTETGHVLIGQWTRIGDNQFAGTFKGAEVTDGVLVHYKLRKSLTLSRDGSTYEGPYAVEVFDVDGNLLTTISGTLQGTRMQIELGD